MSKMKMVWLWILVGLLCIVIAALLLKIFLMKKAADEITAAFAQKLSTETNTLIDISCRDRNMRRLAATLNDQLRQLRTLRRRYVQGDLEIKETITNISHDLRTPLTALCGYLDLLNGLDVSPEVRRYLGRVTDRAEALKQMTEELFHYSILAVERAPDPEPVDLCRALEESLISFFGALRQNGIVPNISLPDEKVFCLANAADLERIFGNIVTNALKYSDGDLTVSLDSSGRIRFANHAKKLDAVAVGKLFDRFYTVETGTRSTGIGLSIARLLTERAGGSIRADYLDDCLVITLVFPRL